MSAIITLTTDFGTGSPYVAAMKGVMLGINPAARLVDISHEVGAARCSAGRGGAGRSVHLVSGRHDARGVVDPGVGTARRLIYARIGRSAIFGTGQWVAESAGQARAGRHESSS